MVPSDFRAWWREGVPNLRPHSQGAGRFLFDAKGNSKEGGRGMTGDLLAAIPIHLIPAVNPKCICGHAAGSHRHWHAGSCMLCGPAKCSGFLPTFQPASELPRIQMILCSICGMTHPPALACEVR
jgi:hypothetical protein